MFRLYSWGRYSGCIIAFFFLFFWYARVYCHIYRERCPASFCSLLYCVISRCGGIYIYIYMKGFSCTIFFYISDVDLGENVGIMCTRIECGIKERKRNKKKKEEEKFFSFIMYLFLSSLRDIEGEILLSEGVEPNFSLSYQKTLMTLRR